MNFYRIGIQDTAEWQKKTENLDIWRAIVANFSEFNVTIYEGQAMFVDQLKTIPQITSLTLGEAILVMKVIIFLFSPSIFCAFIVIFAMLSIDAGVIGSLVWFGADLDPISAVTLLLSIGFSVNFTTHVTYCFYRSRDLITDRLERVQHTLHMIARPSLQSAVSALLGICMMGLVPAYMVRVFFQITSLVIVLGLFHALAVLPVLFSWLKL